MESRVRIPRFGLTFLILGVILIGVAFYGLRVYLNWIILQAMYTNKAGIAWFSTVFYHNYTFIVAGLLALLFINPLPRRSDLFDAFGSLQSMYYRTQGEEREGLRPGASLWVFYQFLKWVIAFVALTVYTGFPPFRNLVAPVLMLQEGLGDWSNVPRIFMLALRPASGSELVRLMPTMEIQYRVLYVVVSAVLIVLMLRFFLKLISHFITYQRNAWLRDLFFLLSALVLVVILGAPYWSMDVTTPFDYILATVVFFGFLAMGAYFSAVRQGPTISLARRRRLIVSIAAIGMIILVGGNLAVIGGFYLNWNNNWTQYEWGPLTAKQITVTRWAAGLDNIEHKPLSDLPPGNATKVLNFVRQWDQEASLTKMKNQIGVNWMQLAGSDIIYVHEKEYWAAPTTINYLSNDWISTNLIYTHAEKILLVDSHSGQFVSLRDAFGVQQEQPKIYYGEGMADTVYVRVPGFHEIGNASYTGEPDYVLRGWQRMLWFLSEGQAGFAFNPPKPDIEMLFKKDVYDRVQSVMIYGLNVDKDLYPVTDGNRIYYAAQVYVSYPMHSGFAASPYLRLFGTVLVDLETGQMKWYFLGKSDGFLVDFYKNYYPSWQKPPDWLIPQLRYPEELLGRQDNAGQLDVDFLFHVNDPFVWRSGSDFFERPPATEVLYIVGVKQDQPKFVALQLVEFRAAPGKNLAGLYLADGGSGLGNIALYRVSNTTQTVTQVIGPTAALQALETDDYVRTQLTLLSNRRIGNILLYEVGKQPYYFIPIYVTTQVAESVITKMAFMVVIDALTGTRVGTGIDSGAGYYQLTGTVAPKEVGWQDRLQKLLSQFKDNGLTTENPVSITANVEIKISDMTYEDESQWNNTASQLSDFMTNYAKRLGSSEVYYWNPSDNSIAFGVLTAQNGVVKLYYVVIQYR